MTYGPVPSEAAYQRSTVGGGLGGLLSLLPSAVSLRAAGYLRFVNAELRRVHGAAWATPSRVSLFPTHAKLEFMLM